MGYSISLAAEKASWRRGHFPGRTVSQRLCWGLEGPYPPLSPVLQSSSGCGS